MSANLYFYEVYIFETCMNGFLDLKYPNFDPKHGFLSSVEAEMISFFQIRQRHFMSILSFFKVAPHPNLINRTLGLGSRTKFLLYLLCNNV